jgi:hypothetical protein
MLVGLPTSAAAFHQEACRAQFLILPTCAMLLSYGRMCKVLKVTYRPSSRARYALSNIACGWLRRLTRSVPVHARRPADERSSSIPPGSMSCSIIADISNTWNMFRRMRTRGGCLKSHIAPFFARQVRIIEHPCAWGDFVWRVLFPAPARRPADERSLSSLSARLGCSGLGAAIPD